MDLQSLNIFIQVAELNSFTKAGEKLGYSQPTVSFQIKQLENELGVQLFDRIGHAISLTDAGRDALGYAQAICNMSQEMLLGENRRKAAVGTVRVAMADSLCSPLIAQRFAQFMENYPNVFLQVQTAGTDKLFTLLDHNEADIVCTLDNHIYNTTYIIAAEEKIDVNFIVSANNPLAEADNITIGDLLTKKFILTEKGMSYRRLLDENMAKYSIEIIPVLEISNPDIIIDLVEQDLGISFLPDYATESSVKAGKIKRIKVQDFDIVVWKQLLYHRDKWVSQPMAAVMEYLSQILLI